MLTHFAQPSKSATAAASLCPPSMNTIHSGVRHPRATVVEEPTMATTHSSRCAASRVRRSVGRVSNRPVASSTIDESW